MEMKWVGMKEMKGTANFMAMIPNGNGRNEWKYKEMKGKWQETKGNVRKWNTLARK